MQQQLEDGDKNCDKMARDLENTRKAKEAAEFEIRILNQRIDEHEHKSGEKMAALRAQCEQAKQTVAESKAEIHDMNEAITSLRD